MGYQSCSEAEDEDWKWTVVCVGALLKPGEVCAGPYSEGKQVRAWWTTPNLLNAKALSRRPKPHFSEDRKDWWRFVKSASLSPSSDHLVLRQERSRQGQKLPKAERAGKASVYVVCFVARECKVFYSGDEAATIPPKGVFFLRGAGSC